jgi:hypothetical protein
MQELTMAEVLMVSGAGKEKEESGTLSRPTRGESEYGRMVNDIAGALTSFGGWFGCKVWDWTHGSLSYN